MKNGWRILIVGVVLVGGTTAWVLTTYQDQIFRMKPIRERLVDTMPVSGTPRFRDEVMGPNGTLCGEVSGVSGGSRIGGPAGSSAQIVPISSEQWRRFIVVPSVPAFYVDGLAPWALSLDGKKIATDGVEMDEQRQEFREQYQLAASYDGIDPARATQEIDIKAIGEHFEAKWADYCPAVAAPRSRT